MRPVRQEHRTPKTRGASGRTPSRGITRGPAPLAHRRARSGMLARAGRFLRGLLDARRPMLWVSLTLLLPFMFAALIASNTFNRTVEKTDSAAGSLVANAGFGVSQVHLAGNLRTRPAEIMAALGLKAGQPIFAVDLRAARARLMQLAWVADAEVKRLYPDDISVRIVERVPYARWQQPDGIYVVERDGHPITREGADQFAKLPLLIGDQAPLKAAQFVAAVAGHRAVAVRVEAYEYVGERRWNLLLDDGVVVELPEDGWQQQLSALDRLIVDKGILERDIREIDLRPPDYYFFVFRNGTGQKQKKQDAGSAI